MTGVTTGIAVGNFEKEICFRYRVCHEPVNRSVLIYDLTYLYHGPRLALRNVLRQKWGIRGLVF
jgi:hypothetical protein